MLPNLARIATSAVEGSNVQMRRSGAIQVRFGRETPAGIANTKREIVMKLRVVLMGLISLAAPLCFQAAPAQAQLYFSVSSGTPTWIDDGMTSNWGTASGGPYNSTWWMGGSDAHFEGTGGSVNVNGTINLVGGLYFDVNGYSLNPDPSFGGGIASLGGNGINLPGGVGATVGVPLTLSASQSWTNNGTTLMVSGAITNGGSLLTIAGSGQTVISGNIGPGSGGITKADAGTLVLNGANTYSGTTTLSAGVLDINSATALGGSTLAISGGTIDNTSGHALTLSNSNYLNLGTGFTFLGSSNLSLGAGTIANFPSGTTVTANIVSGVLTLNGPQGVASSPPNSGSITKTGSGNLYFTNSTLKWSGTTSMAGGAIEMPYGHTNANTYYQFNGGVLQEDWTSGGVNNISFALATAGGGRMGWASGASGGFAAQGHALNYSVGNVTWGTGPFITSGGSLLFGSATSNATANLQSNINLGSGTRSVYVAAGQSGNYGQMSGQLTGAAGALAKGGPGGLILSGNNSYGAGTFVQQGELYLNSTTAIASSGVINVYGGATLGGTANMTSRNITVNIAAGGGLEGGQSGSGALTLPNATFADSGSITVPVTLPSIYLDQTSGVGLSVGTLTTGGGSAGTVVNVSGTAYPTFQGTTPAPVHLVKYTTLAGAGANFATGSLNLSSPLGVGGVSVVSNTAQGYIDLSYYANYAIWSGMTSGNFGDTDNFVRSDNGAPLTFANGYDIYFDDSAGSANSAITLSSTTGVSPRTICFNNNSVNYTINGSGVYGGGPPPNLWYGGFIGTPTVIFSGRGTVTFTDSSENSLGYIYLNNGVLSSETPGLTKTSGYPIVMNGGTFQWAASAGANRLPWALIHSSST